ncbi:MAG: hypothetical protein HKN91_00610 [Acidimicrobiia bacterium]|nr:hypothetical protein [Acidimicrobiia bacterium]
MKPKRWSDPSNKLFPHQVGFTSPPHDFDAAPSDFLRMVPDTVGVHGRLLHVNDYGHELSQRVDNFHLLEEVVAAMANAGVDCVGQVGSNWVHVGGRTPDDIREFTMRVSEEYETPFHMAGMCVVEGLQALGAEKIALNAVYYWPDWRDGIARWLKQAGFDVVYSGNFVDQGFYETQEAVNDCTWIFPNELAEASLTRVAEQAPDAEAIVVIGMPNFRREDGVPERTVHRAAVLEAILGMPLVSSDFALYWRILQTINVAPLGRHGKLMSMLQEAT